MIQIVRLSALPDIAKLREEAAAEGYSHMERLAADWADGSQVFDQEGEALFGVFIDGEIAGIGGVTREPTNLNGREMRARRLYVSPRFRLHGIGRALVGAIVQQCFETEPALNVHTTRADEFWRKMGFSFVSDERGITHRLLR